MKELLILLLLVGVWGGCWVLVVKRTKMRRWLAHLCGFLAGWVVAPVAILPFLPPSAPSEKDAAPVAAEAPPPARDVLAISAEDIGAAWPLTIQGGRFGCGEASALLLEHGGVVYALNGTARGRIKNNPDWRDIDAVWDKQRQGGNIGEVISRGIEACKQAGLWNADRQLAKPAPNNSGMAAIICAGYVEDRLLAPKSADFPWGKDARGVWQMPDQVYVIKSYVDSQNAFGAMVRTNYRCEIKAAKGGSGDPGDWRLIKLDFEQ
ncbi:hypothetical protein GPA19_08005 [Azoarcus indigens]|uniref:Uncharacterized protein n=1 Tax=Azoarcus indigens TaxID=29545 RepID=A0A4R6DYJ6_9RHOO|nr:DUF2511 domain-containing protein [Azoarcus indigens]NMG64887.1 hypothetical protein [Azoarcus indigens]TDN50425.1 hypothetical protein C7389_109119 [Azoarcus indigens]